MEKKVRTTTCLESRQIGRPWRCAWVRQPVLWAWSWLVPVSLPRCDCCAKYGSHRLEKRKKETVELQRGRKERKIQHHNNNMSPASTRRMAIIKRLRAALVCCFSVVVALHCLAPTKPLLLLSLHSFHAIHCPLRTIAIIFNHCVIYMCWPLTIELSTRSMWIPGLHV